jgi:FkbM family methyltransferase
MWSLLEFFPIGTQINILDVGAALHESPPYKSLMDAGVGRLFGFEPDPRDYARLNEEYGDPHRFFQCFVGDGSRSTFHQTNQGATGSLYAPNSRLLEKFQNMAESVTPVATHAVDTVRIDDIAEIDDIDFLKIDVQGAGLPVLQNAMRAMSSALVVQIEVEFVELYQGQPMFADVDIYLRAQGFQFHTFDGFGSRAFKPLAPQGNQNAGFRQCLWSDAIYVRDWMHLESLSEVKLRHYAILAHDLLRSYDLAHFVLAALDRSAKSNFAASYVRRLTGVSPTKSHGKS